jgi:putative peptidoglycan lipid II flippase
VCPLWGARGKARGLLLRTESFRKGIAFSTAFNAAAKLISFGNTIVIAAYFGTTTTTDVFFYLLATITALSGFITGFSSAVLIPEAIHRKEHRSEGEAIGFLNSFLYIFLGIGAVLTLAAMIAPVRLFTAISHFDPARLSEERSLLMLSLPLICLLTVNNYLKDCISIYRYFTMPMVMSAVNSSLSIAFILLFHHSLSVKSITLGLLCGNLLNLVMLVATMAVRVRWAFAKISSIGGAVARRVAFVQAGAFAALLSGYYPMYLLSGFQAGTIAALNFGKQIADTPGLFITNQFSGVAGIKYNELHARNETTEFDRIYVQSTEFLAFLLLPVAVFFCIFSRDIVTVLFKRGAFGVEGVEVASLFLKLFALSIPLIAIDSLSARAFMAARKTNQTFWYQICSNVFMIVCLGLTIRRLGVIAYPLAFFATYAISFPMQYFMFRSFCPYIRYRRIITGFLKMLGMNLLAAFPAFLAASFLRDSSPILRMAIGLLLYGGGLIALNHFLDVNRDARDLVKAAAALKFGRFVEDRRA